MEYSNCLNQRFGHNYVGGVCLNCRGFQNPISKIRIDRKWKENKSGSARAYLVSQFLEELNKSRDETKYPKLTPARMGMILSPIKKIEDLRWFWDSLWQEDKLTGRKVFQTKLFWWKLKK